ncbi:hypothetical protein ACQQ2N_01270 [Dokdonella sp. MW10]|uniref:hypothetical protein n=1 Tax=Dokdonella sp. MW10 TaxID=2992926 RepID=UPI003F7DD79A
MSEAGRALACSVGVVHAERIRVWRVDELPLPQAPALREAVAAMGLLGASTLGLTLGHAVLVRHGHLDIRIASHEFRHVHQYEKAGSIACFLPVYVQQLVTHGYANAPLEIDARLHEAASGERGEHLLLRASDPSRSDP